MESDAEAEVESEMSDASPPRVLIVDDESHILAALRRSLRREGYAMVTAETPFEALQYLEENPVDLILSDQKMPGMSGVEFLTVARRLRPAAVRMMITGWSEAVSPDDLAAIGVQSLIPKPWDDSLLKKEIRGALASRERFAGRSEPAS